MELCRIISPPLPSSQHLSLHRSGRLWCFLSGGLDFQGLPGFFVLGDASIRGPKGFPGWPPGTHPAAALQRDALERPTVSVGYFHPHVSGTTGQNPNVYGVCVYVAIFTSKHLGYKCNYTFTYLNLNMIFLFLFKPDSNSGTKGSHWVWFVYPLFCCLHRKSSYICSAKMFVSKSQVAWHEVDNQQQETIRETCVSSCFRCNLIRSNCSIINSVDRKSLRSLPVIFLMIPPPKLLHIKVVSKYTFQMMMINH